MLWRRQKVHTDVLNLGIVEKSRCLGLDTRLLLAYLITIDFSTKNANLFMVLENRLMLYVSSCNGLRGRP